MVDLILIFRYQNSDVPPTVKNDIRCDAFACIVISHIEVKRVKNSLVQRLTKIVKKKEIIVMFESSGLNTIQNV